MNTLKALSPPSQGASCSWRYIYLPPHMTSFLYTHKHDSGLESGPRPGPFSTIGVRTALPIYIPNSRVRFGVWQSNDLLKLSHMWNISSNFKCMVKMIRESTWHYFWTQGTMEHFLDKRICIITLWVVNKRNGKEEKMKTEHKMNQKICNTIFRLSVQEI